MLKNHFIFCFKKKIKGETGKNRKRNPGTEYKCRKPSRQFSGAHRVDARFGENSNLLH